MSILTAEYDFDTAIAVRQGEAYADGLEEGISVGLEQGAYQTKLETARALLAEGLAPAMIARCTNLPLETVQELMEN